MSIPKSVLLVYSVGHAIKAEKLLSKQAITCKLVPVPRHLSSDCGICIRFNTADAPAVTAAVKEAGIESAGTFEL